MAIKRDYITQTEGRILKVLSDGLRHTKKELLACIDSAGLSESLKVHVCNIRKVLRRKGQDIVCEFYKGGYHYRHVVLLKRE